MAADQALLPQDAPGNAVFVCRDLTYVYLDRFQALQGVSVNLLAGERWRCSAPNGCGKSTHPIGGTFHAFGELSSNEPSTTSRLRGLASRYDKYALVYRGGVVLAAIVLWLS